MVTVNDLRKRIDLLLSSKAAQEIDCAMEELTSYRTCGTGLSQVAATAANSFIHRLARSRGEPLAAADRAFLEPCFRRNLGDVRVHADEQAAEIARALDAQAFAVGNHVYFAGPLPAVDRFARRRLLAHELVHVLQNDRHASQTRHAVALGLEPPDSPAEQEAERVADRVARGLPAGAIVQTNAGIACTKVSTIIEGVISYSKNLVVTDKDEKTILGLLRGDPQLSETIRDLAVSGQLTNLIDRIDEPANRFVLIQLLTGRPADPFTFALTASALSKLSDHSVTPLGTFMGHNQREVATVAFNLQYALSRVGVPRKTPPRITLQAIQAVLGSPEAPFSASGATGIMQMKLDWIGTWTALKLVFGDRKGETHLRYRNPLYTVGLSYYLSQLSPGERIGQAKTLLLHPIGTVLPDSYTDVPSRADVIRAAAGLYDLEPELLGAFLLAEQRDQSRNEDAAEYQPVEVYGRDSSIGLGQVKISTARKHDLFVDLLPQAAPLRRNLRSFQVAHLLASDEFNIFAVARYIRIVANAGATKSAASLPKTKSWFPQFNPLALRNHSRTWPADNIRALGSEYTSKMWDDDLEVQWGDFVFEAYLHVKGSGVF